ncbi:hypothetical protein N4G37_13365, partial [Enterococcus faecalis]|nr:hypothetical protein [Enterococcus faecalis]
MQPVDASSGGTWEPQIQQQNTMPAGMDQSVYSPSTSQPSLPVSHQPTPPTSSSFDIPRKPVTGEPDYSKIARGSYQGESYT